ncbi:RidA family protein [Streptomyces sp. NA04227]|uniref:RidA family protein n=1 Tax=Streptomyces sp. NA04227 TaxID=2742136 RepID=UPI0015912C89|nr:RidA family protein [Streptomyces sp. NA04227]QKW09678.1 RidA family protein [Streptomyces sp. NA04227]
MAADLDLVTEVPGVLSGTAWHWAGTVDQLVFTSGQIGWDEQGEVVGADDPVAQTEQAFANLARTLEAAGSSMDRIVKITGFIARPDALEEIRSVRDRWLPTRPPSTFVFVTGLVQPELIVEFEAIAVKKG